MDLAETLAAYFAEHEYEWKTKRGDYFVPDKNDMQSALDEAAVVLYDEPVGSQLSVGRLIFNKSTGTLIDVYVLAGTYS